MTSDQIMTALIVGAAVIYLVFLFRSKASSSEGCGKGCGCSKPEDTKK